MSPARCHTGQICARIILDGVNIAYNILFNIILYYRKCRFYLFVIRGKRGAEAFFSFAFVRSSRMKKPHGGWRGEHNNMRKRKFNPNSIAVGDPFSFLFRRLFFFFFSGENFNSTQVFLWGKLTEYYMANLLTHTRHTPR